MDHANGAAVIRPDEGTKKHGEQAGHVLGYGKLAAVWLALMDLTALTVLVTRVEAAHFKVAGALAIACAKGGLVIMYFMHMKDEGKLLRWLLFVTILTFAVFIGLTFFDVLYR